MHTMPAIPLFASTGRCTLIARHATPKMLFCMFTRLSLLFGISTRCSSQCEVGPGVHHRHVGESQGDERDHEQHEEVHGHELVEEELREKHVCEEACDQRNGVGGEV